ncbi:NADPH:quinone reductase [Rugosimonospora africana]|uniref:NADPH:quinone reductase n=1 Tax=Rugosimonospora africana TaxID=556532 RepID=A0A8J3QRZ5_9ACTN|nr:NADPH:quinone reductase [Rugosimonospora africana]GIH14031.1 NADPH:quinone reductase [Rugosimonospora africana]
MRAVIYAKSGDPDVLSLVDRPVPDPGPGEVRVAVRVSGVNPTDWKSRRRQMGFDEQVPNQDGAGVIDAVGPGVDPARTGQRVWIWEAAWQRPGGTAQEYVVLPERQAVALPDGASFDLGASLGIPALTAHRCLTVAEAGPQRLVPGALSGRTVLVAGGAGAVGNAAIQLAVWSGARVVTTVSSPEKAELARAAGAHHVVNYRTEQAAEAIRSVAPGGVDIVVEVAPATNAALDGDVLAANGVVAMYANESAEPVIPLGRGYALNARWQGVLVYTVPVEAKEHAVADVVAAVAAGAVRVGPDAGLPLHHFPLERIADAHAAVENNAVGKVLVTI